MTLFSDNSGGSQILRHGRTGYEWHRLMNIYYDLNIYFTCLSIYPFIYLLIQLTFVHSFLFICLIPKLKVVRNNMFSYMGVSKNRGTTKWMVYNGKPY